MKDQRRLFTVTRGYVITDESLTDEQIEQLIDDNETEELEDKAKPVHYEGFFWKEDHG